MASEKEFPKFRIFGDISSDSGQSQHDLTNAPPVQSAASATSLEANGRMGEWRVGGWVVTVGGVFRELAAEFVRAERLRRRPFKAISGPLGSLRLAAQDVALSRRKQGFESPRERQ